MQGVGCVAAMAAWWRVASCGALAGVLMLLALAGCTAMGPNPGVMAQDHSSTVALDSVDGPPAQVSQKFLSALDEAASAHQIAVVARETTAPYRLRGYLALHGRPGATSIAWAWDIYDTTERRAFRLHGEEAAGAGKSWAAANDEVLRRIARASAEQLALFLAQPGKPESTEPTSVVTRGGGALLSQIDDFAPEASGIFRIFHNEPPSVEVGVAGSGGAVVPLPPDRPVPAAVDAALAFNGADE